jgi:hypothetical protein
MTSERAEHTIVRYRLKPECVAENEALVAEVFEALARTAPTDLRYACLKLDDGVTFVHIVQNRAGAAQLPQLPAFKKFTSQIRERCAEPPAANSFTVVGSFDLLER